MHAVYLHTAYHMPNPNDLLVIAIEPKAIYRIHVAAILFCYSIQRCIIIRNFRFLYLVTVRPHMFVLASNDIISYQML
jgi:hypothetical protein